MVSYRQKNYKYLLPEVIALGVKDTATAKYMRRDTILLTCLTTLSMAGNR
ncbi:MAG: hypothetical protein LUD69_04505 [Oscillospiraceae bacterium]|nr:hypothetical protein [Oscillospiraceae bacterium]